MMIHPEGYYEMFLKGKSQKELRTEINSLKRQINRLKREIEDPSENDGIKMFPSPLTRLKMNKEYLVYAIKAYEEAGGVYIPAKAEQKSRDFDQALDSLDKLVFSIGGFFNGYEKRTFTVKENSIELEVETTLGETAINQYDYSYTKDEFIAELRRIHIGEWKREYRLSSFAVMDGTQWELKIQFCGEHKPVKSCGDNAYPYNFDELKELLEVNL